MSKLLFLPDRNGREKESEGAGLVRLSADTSEMAALAKRMVIRQETGEITPDAAYQGAMALALLLDSWQGTDVRLAVRTIDAQKSRFASWGDGGAPDGAAQSADSSADACQRSAGSAAGTCGRGKRLDARSADGRHLGHAARTRNMGESGG